VVGLLRLQIAVAKSTCIPPCNSYTRARTRIQLRMKKRRPILREWSGLEQKPGNASIQIVKNIDGTAYYSGRLRTTEGRLNVKKAIISFIVVRDCLYGRSFHLCRLPNRIRFRVERTACIKARPEKIYSSLKLPQMGNSGRPGIDWIPE